MPIKRSAILLMVLTASSLSLLVFSSAKTLPAISVPAECDAIKCTILIETGEFSPWELLPHILIRPAA